MAAAEGLAARRFGILGRLSWGLADQALSSITNFALAIAVARTASPEDFGAFSLVFIVFLLGLNIVRPLATEPLAVRYSGPADDRWRAAAARATGVAFDVGAIGGFACLAIGVVVGNELGLSFLALAATFPGLLLQDAWRFAFFSCRRGQAAFVNDLVFTMLLLPVLVIMSTGPEPAVAAFVLAWGGAATMGGLVGIIQARLLPNPLAARGWLTEHRDLAPPLVGARIAWVGQGQLSAFTVAAVSGLATIGILRAGELMMGPVNVAIQGINLMAVPEGARLLQRSMASLVLGCRFLVAALLVATLAWGAVVTVLPDEIGVEFLGELWAPARSILLPMVVAVAGYSMMVGASVGLLVLAEGGLYLRVGLATSGLMLVATTAGAAAGGPFAAAVGSAVAIWIGAGIAWWQFGQATRNRPA